MHQKNSSQPRGGASQSNGGTAVTKSDNTNFLHVPYGGGDPHGIFGATPYESLHTLLTGCIKHSLNALFGYQAQFTVQSTGEKKYKKILNKTEFERRVRVLSTFSQRQSDRNMPRANFNTGVTTLAGLNGQEYVGLSLLTIVALPGMLSDIQLEKKFSCLLWMGMSLYQWHTLHGMRKRDLDLFQKNTRKYITLYNEIIEPQ